MKPLADRVVRRIVAAVLAGERRRADVSVTFLGPARMRTLNREHLGHDRPTDVISFALPAPDGGLMGDVYVCRAEAARQAKALGVPLREELVRLVVHGTLHVLGYDHPEGEGRTTSAMWRRQERYVRRLA
ncbi:MAG TPA: rRNA maturation RNase YbeY [Gemmatimonadales bacterium]|nr:rRNA maturation RNase YbeY [Gemmatimonadales bacterium]